MTLKNKIIKLNKAHNQMISAIKIIKTVYKGAKDILIAVKGVDRAYTKLYKLLLKDMKNDQMNEDFNRLIINIDKED